MSDIVERLNDAADVMSAHSMRPTGVPELCVEASQEIIRLRATIEQLRSVAGVVSMESPTFSEIKKEIRDVK